MQVRYRFQAAPVRALVAVLIALAALLGAGVLGYSLGQAKSASHGVPASGQSIQQSASQAASQAHGVSAFPYGPADRAGVLTVAQAAGQAHRESGFPYGPADRTGGLGGIAGDRAIAAPVEGMTT